jgi:CheY-like chemotaxis protein
LAKILVADDDELILHALTVLMESNGHTIITASDGDKALELIRGSKPDLLISDLRMKPTNGIELLRDIRKEWPDLPVIMITAFASAETRDESSNLGAVAYLAKPFTNEEVMSAVVRALAPPPPCGPPAMEQLVNEYMSREHVADSLEAKNALADELYWLSQNYPTEKLLSALNEAMGKQDIPIECVNELLKYRETVLHVKKVLGTYAETKGKDPANLLQEISATVADARARHNTDDQIIQFLCRLLGLGRRSLTPEDLDFFNEYYSCSKPPESVKHEAPTPPVQETPRPAPAGEEPQPIRERDLLKDAIAGNMEGFTDDDIRNLIQKLRADRILKADELAVMGKQVAKALRGRTDDATKELKRTIKDHLSLTDVKSFYSAAELATLETLKVSTDDIQKALENLNGMLDQEEVILGLKKLIAESAQQKLMSKLGIRYCKKRYAVAYGSRKPGPSSDT